MVQRLKSIVSVLVVSAFIGLPVSDAWAQGKTRIKYALGDVISIDELPLLIAVERAKQRGVDVEVTSFKSEEVATQAVINGQADVGQGTPYAAIQKVGLPTRFFHQSVRKRSSRSSRKPSRATCSPTMGAERARQRTTWSSTVSQARLGART